MEVQALQEKPLPPNMSGILEEMKASIKADVLKEVKDEMDTIRNIQHKSHLLEEIRRHDPGMIIFGHAWADGVSINQVRGLLRTRLQYGNRADSVTVKAATLLSSGRGTNLRQTVLVMFGSVSERDECLRQSYHLVGTSISFIKYMPKCFEQQYRKFREKAKNLRTALNVNTYIGFEGHELVLKQKQKDTATQKFGWVVFDRWHPHATEHSHANLNQQISGASIGASQAIAVDALSHMIFITGIKTDTSKEVVENNFVSEFIGTEDRQMVERAVMPKAGNAILHLISGADAKALSLKYNGKEFKGAILKVSPG